MPLRYAWQASAHGKLPNEGSLRDQPAKLMSQMNVSHSVYRAFKDFIQHGLSDDNWVKKHEDQWEIISKVNATRNAIKVNPELLNVDARVQVREGFKRSGILSFIVFEILKLDIEDVA